MGTLNLRSITQFIGNYAGSSDLTDPDTPIDVSFDDLYTHGNGNLQAEVWWGDERTLVATSESLDLQGGLTDEYGNAITFLTLKELFIRNLTTTQYLVLSGSAMLLFFNNYTAGDEFTIEYGGKFHYTSPYLGVGVTGAKRYITLDSGAATVTYRIILVGTITV